MTRTTLAVFVALFSTSCALDYEDSPSIGSSDQAFKFNNKLSPSNLSDHVADATALANTNLIASGELNYGTRTIHTTTAGREVLQYLAACALDAADTLVVKYGGQTYNYPGKMGIATGWKTNTSGITDAGEKEAMSSCLFAFVNAKGAEVHISIRSAIHVGLEVDEAADYPVYEGTFMGSYFENSAGNIKWYACQGDDETVARKASTDRVDRVCADADGTYPCDIDEVGRCSDICTTRDPIYGWTNCTADGVTYQNTISVYLQDATGTEIDTCGVDQTCDGASKLASTAGAEAILDCSSASSCTAECNGNGSSDPGYCLVNGSKADASSANTVNVTANANTFVDVNCHEAGTCNVDCSDSSSDCQVDCKDATSCNLTCPTGEQACTNGNIKTCATSCS